MLPINCYGMFRQRDARRGTGAPHQCLRSRTAALLLALLIAAQPGCITAPRFYPQKTEYQGSLGRVAVVAALQAPTINFKGFVQNKGEGAARGAGAVGEGCLEVVTGGGCRGEMCGAFLLVGLVVCAVITPIGAVAGAISAPSAKEVKSAKASLSAALEVKLIQETLRDQVITRAHANDVVLTAIPYPAAADTALPADYRPLAEQGWDTAIEVAITNVATDGRGINLPLTLNMIARVRLVRTRDNAELLRAEYVYGGGKMKLSEWSANQNERLLKSLNAGFGVLGSHIYDNVFLLYPFPDRDVEYFEGRTGIGLPQHAFGLVPIYPGVSGTSAEEPPALIFSAPTSYKVTDSLRPTFRWQSFPRKQDVEKAPEDMARLKDVRYDLVIAREENEAPAEIVYRREQLPSNEHTIETPLNPKTRYFWSVRARFIFGGRERVTEWATTNIWEWGTGTAPSIWAYRFRTP